MTNEEAIEVLEPYVFTDEELTPTIRRYSEALSMAIQALKTVQEHEGTFEWCVDCKEYDQEQHCCHRWTKQIRKTIAEFEEDNGIVICGECKYRGDDGRCSEFADDNIRPTGWIPVSERLPEKNGCYLVSTTGTNNDIIDIAYYIEGMWHKASRIKAWMPLPEPYREDGEA